MSLPIFVRGNRPCVSQALTVLGLHRSKAATSLTVSRSPGAMSGLLLMSHFSRCDLLPQVAAEYWSAFLCFFCEPQLPRPESTTHGPFCTPPATSARRAGRERISACSQADVRLAYCKTRRNCRFHAHALCLAPKFHLYRPRCCCIFQVMENITYNKAITRISLPEQLLPVLVPINESQMDYRRRAGIFEPVDGYFYADGGNMVPVRCVSEPVGTLSSQKKWKAFEAKYGFTIHEPTRKNLFFMVMLAKALEGPDPNRGVQDALRYYRGDQPDGLFREGGPVSQGIQQEPLRVVLEMLNNGLEEARPVVWWSFTKKRASLGLYCPNANSALYALALKGMGLPGGLGVCQRCGNPFYRSRRTQRYCSHRCQLNASMRRFRERKGSARDRNKRTKNHGRKIARRKKR